MGIKDDLSETECGNEIKQAMYKGYLTNFFSDNKKDSYNLSDHWLKWGDGTKSKFYLDLSDKTDDKIRLKIDGQSPDDQIRAKKAAIQYIRRSPFFRTSKHVKTEMIDDIAQRKRKTPYTSSQRGSSITSFSYTNQGSKDPKTGRMRQIYFSKLASAPAQEVFLKEYFSTAYDFENLDSALDIYNGWRKSSFSTCNCQKLIPFAPNEFEKGTIF